MEKSKSYYGIRFTSDAIRDGHAAFLSHLAPGSKPGVPQTLKVGASGETWSVGSVDEFLAMYANHPSYALLHIVDGQSLHISDSSSRGTYISLTLSDKASIDAVFQAFEDARHAGRTMLPAGNRVLSPITRRRWYSATKFPGEVIAQAYRLFCTALGLPAEHSTPMMLMLGRADEEWHVPTLEEFLADYADCTDYHLRHVVGDGELRVEGDEHGASVSVTLGDRSRVAALFWLFDGCAAQSRIIVSDAPIRVFVGHGRDVQWRDLKDHLHEQHGLEVTAHEIGPRAGLSVKDVLEGMLSESSFAALVLTGEDVHTDGETHARQNVVHELGLFQGRLGFSRAVVLLEDGVTEFSNILGVNQIRFSKGRIRETFGDVVATIRREFSSA